MSITKNAFLRYKTLDKCFSNKFKKFTIDDLLNEVNKVLIREYGVDKNIQRRQLFYDIRFMESEEGWSIDLDKLPIGKKKYYKYTDPDFSINNAPLNENEKELLEMTVELLTKFTGIAQSDWIYDVIPKLESKILTNTESYKIAFEENEFLKGREHLRQLTFSVLNNQIIIINYKPFFKPGFSLKFKPLYLKQYNRRWFLFGHGFLDDKILTFAIDRIESIEVTSDIFENNMSMDIHEKLQNVIGVSNAFDKKQIETIVFEVNNNQAKYIETKPIHGSQKKIRGHHTSRFQIEVVPNYELEQLLLSFGEHLKIIEPLSLRSKIKYRIEQSLSSY